MITTHHDADGLSAAYLYTLANGEDTVEIRDFGNIAEGSTVVLDMHPSPSFEGLVIDHHPNHPSERKYELIFDNTPTAVIVFKNYKDKIPTEKWWITAIGAVGDMEPYSIPSEVWDTCPLLKTRHTKFYGYKNVPFHLRLYHLLSSGVNALCRLGHEFDAWDVLEEAQSPIDVINDPRCLEAKQLLKQRVNSILQELELVEWNDVLIGQISSDIAVEGRIATQLSRNMQETILIQNTETGAFSIRGDLSTWLEEKLRAKAGEKKIELVVGGHAEAKGGTITPPTLSILSLLE